MLSRWSVFYFAHCLKLKYLGLNRLCIIPHFLVEFDLCFEWVLVYWVLKYNLNAIEEYCINEGPSCNHKLALLRFHYCVIRFFSLTWNFKSVNYFLFLSLVKHYKIWNFLKGSQQCRPPDDFVLEKSDD